MLRQRSVLSKRDGHSGVPHVWGMWGLGFFAQGHHTPTCAVSSAWGAPSPPAPKVPLAPQGSLTTSSGEALAVRGSPVPASVTAGVRAWGPPLPIRLRAEETAHSLCPQHEPARSQARSGLRRIPARSTQEWEQPVHAARAWVQGDPV